MAPVLKTGVPERVSGVRIPPLPPSVLTVNKLEENNLDFYEFTGDFAGSPTAMEGESVLRQCR